jgi:hypothetical protein
MADPTWRKGTDDDTEIEMRPVRTGAVPAALKGLDELLKAQPQGAGAKRLFGQVRGALAGWWNLVDQQQWEEVSHQVGGVLQTVIESAEDAGHVDDLPLLDELQQRLVALQDAAAAAR